MEPRGPNTHDRVGDRFLGGDAESPARFYVVELSHDDEKIAFGLVSEGHGIEPSICPLDSSQAAIALDSALHFMSISGDAVVVLRSDYIIFELHVIGDLLIVYTEAAIYAVSIERQEVAWRDYASDIITDFAIESHRLSYQTLEGDSVTLTLADGTRA